MAGYSGILAWTILWAEEPGGIQSVGSQATVHGVAQSQTRLKWLSSSSQSYGFSSSLVCMLELDHKAGRTPKNWCFWTVVWEKTLENPSDCKEIQPVHPKGNQFWIFIGRTDAEAETPILWPPDAKNWLLGKDPDAGKDWGQRGGEWDDRGWDGWMAPVTQWTWVLSKFCELVMDREA